MPYSVKTLVNGPLEQNCYFLHEEGRKLGLLVDPGSEPERLATELDQAGLQPCLIVATHGHFDHIGAVEALASRYACPFGMSRHDAFLLDVLEDNCAFYGMGETRRPKVDRWLEAGTPLEADGLSLAVLPTPGHTPGGLCFWHAASQTLFSGDTLFAGSVGRSDFEGSSHEQLIASIRRELLVLPDSASVYPGHGPSTTLGEERLNNRFLR